LSPYLTTSSRSSSRPRPTARRPQPWRRSRTGRAAPDRGAVAIVARDATGTVIGAGCCSPVVDGYAEVAATGVAVSHRRRGIAQALAHRLAWEAIERGAEVPFLMAADKAERRIYERSGFATVGEILHISRWLWPLRLPSL